MYLRIGSARLSHSSDGQFAESSIQTYPEPVNER